MEEETRKMEQEPTTKATAEKTLQRREEKEPSVYRSKGLSMLKLNKEKNVSMSILTKVLCLQRQRKLLKDVGQNQNKTEPKQRKENINFKRTQIRLTSNFCSNEYQKTLELCS